MAKMLAKNEVEINNIVSRIEKLNPDELKLLSWFLDGLIVRFDLGLSPVKMKIPAIDVHQSMPDPIADFLSDCTIQNLSGRIPAKRFYEVYSKWAKQKGIFAESITMFGRKLVGKGIFKRKTKTGNFYLGFSLTAI